MKMRVCGKNLIGNKHLNLNVPIMSNSHPLVSELSRENLSTFFILPLLKLNKFRFGDANFINSYLTNDSKYIVVKIKDNTLLPQSAILHPNFDDIIDKDTYFLIVYTIPKEYDMDVELYCQGAYSLFSDKTKDKIRKYSGLVVEKLIGAVSHSDPRLLALEKAQSLKDFWIDLLWDNYRDSVLDDTDELLSKPGKESFIEL